MNLTPWRRRANAVAAQDSVEADDPGQRRRRLSALPALHRDVATSIGASLGTQLALLLSGVAGARILGVLDRGHSALLLLFATVLPVIGTLGMPLSVTYWIAQHPGVGQRVLRSLSRILALQTIAVTAVHAGVLFVVFHHSASYVQISAAISLLGTPAIIAWIYALAVLQGTQQFTALNLCRMIFPPLNAALLMAFLLSGVGDLILVTATWVSLYLLSAGVTAVAAYRGVAAVADESVASVPSVRTMSNFGLKAWLGSVTPLEGFQLDQAIVGLFISQAALGVYVVAVAFTNLPRFVAQSIGLVAYPNVAAENTERGRRRKIVNFAALTLVLCGVTVVVTELALPFLVPRLFGSAFHGAVGVGRILLISALLFGIRRVLSECARGDGRPLVGTVAEAVSLVTLAPFVILFSSDGAKGVALALVLTSAAGVAATVIGLIRRPTALAPAAPPLEADETSQVGELVT
jgi:O-antigen/teichoic acid export membrane protein